MPKNSCIMQIWAESGKSALPICNYSQILYQFLAFTQNLKRSQGLSTGSSSLLKNVTGGYHYHTIEAESEEILDDIQNELAEKGFLAKLQDYEPVDFWGEEESNTNV